MTLNPTGEFEQVEKGPHSAAGHGETEICKSGERIGTKLFLAYRLNRVLESKKMFFFFSDSPSLSCSAYITSVLVCGFSVATPSFIYAYTHINRPRDIVSLFPLAAWHVRNKES